MSDDGAPAGLHARLARIFEPLVAGAAAATLPLLLLETRYNDSPVLNVFDWALWAVFTVEFVVLLATAPSRVRYLRSSWLSLAVVVLTFPLLPSLLSALRLARLARMTSVLRVARVGLVSARGAKALRAILGRAGFVYVLGLTGIVVVVGGWLMSVLEPETVKGDLWSGVWWATVTASTVGYGDISPATGPGRIIAVLLMVAGIGLFGTLAASITAYFVGQEQDREVLRRVERIEQLLEDLLRQRDA
jgi:voltage-gated potassium channel